MRKVLNLICLLILPAWAYSQLSYNNDAALWMHVNLNKKIDRKNEVYLNFQGRLDQNWSHFSRFSSELGYSYRLHKNLELNAGYVFIQRVEPESYISYRNRLYVSGIFKASYLRWDFRLRTAIQTTWKDYLNSENGYIPSTFSRNRLTVRYQLNKRIKLYTAAEIFLPLNHQPPKNFSQLRWAGGVSYKLNKHSELYTYYMLRQELESYNEPYRNYVTGIGYEYNF